jgi:endonuclease/exonuclease/phosphatase family metal-dependent hydrolase
MVCPFPTAASRLLFGVLFLCSIFVLSPTPVLGQNDDSMSVATYNIRFANPNDGDNVWPNRKAAVAKYIDQLDLAGLQEVTQSQFEFLRESLPEFAAYGVGRDDGNQGGEHSPLFYRKSRFEALDQGTFWLSDTPDQVGSVGWDAALPRICSWMHLRDLKSEREFLVANTHFDHVGVEAREQSGRLLAARAKELPEGLPVILMGDFNCLADSAPYEAITESLQDVREVSRQQPSGPNSTWSGFQSIAPDRIIDHMFVRGVNVHQVTIDDPKTAEGRFASDHLPVRVNVSLAEREQANE